MEEKLKDYLLFIKDINAGYGEIQTLWEISLSVKSREIIALLGGNGAGKSTLINTISGIIFPTRGNIYFEGEDISFLNPTKRVKIGITQIPEGRLLFPGLTVLQNLRLGAFTRRARKGLDKDLEFVFHLFPRLYERKNQLAGTLSGGEQQMCAIGRGLMSNPKLLLIDELSLGLAPLIVDHIMEALRRVYEEKKLSIILVEQDVQLGLEFSHRAYVIETGKIVKEGNSKDLIKDTEIRRAYLGL